MMRSYQWCRNERNRWLSLFSVSSFALLFSLKLWPLCFFCLPDCLITPTRASGTGSSWQCIAGGKERRARGPWRYLTRPLSCVTRRCWVRNKWRNEVQTEYASSAYNLKPMWCDASHVQSRHGEILKHMTLFPNSNSNSQSLILMLCLFRYEADCPYGTSLLSYYVVTNVAVAHC